MIIQDKNKGVILLNAVKFRIYPNAQQKTLISKHFGCSRVVYNYFLDYR